MRLKRIYFLFLCVAATISFAASCRRTSSPRVEFSGVKTFAGFSREFGEPFGLAFDKTGVLYVSDGEQGKIFRVVGGKIETLTDKLDTPSQIAFDAQNFLIVADSGSHSIKRIDTVTGNVETIAGINGAPGDADGAAKSALFNAPVGVAVYENKIYVADTYNDKIRVVENGQVSTLAGGAQGFADGSGAAAEFDTPCGIAVTKAGDVIVADFGNRRIRRVEANGKVSTLAGTGEADSVDGELTTAKFVQPLAVAVDELGVIYIADGNSIRVIGRRLFPFVETISATKRGDADGKLSAARFNCPSGLAVDARGNLFVADAENQTVRIFTGENSGSEITSAQIEKLRFSAQEFRALQPARWCYDPPSARREIAGTLGEIRGEAVAGKQTWFHNGLDVTGNYGETARFVRAEKVLRPDAAQNFATPRELIRMPMMGYIHIRLGRDAGGNIFQDRRFQFSRDDAGKLKGVRIPRGAKFAAGDAIGTLNSLNHVHLIAGRTGAEMNALAALILPGISDTVAPTIEKVSLFDENWRQIETGNQSPRIKIGGKTRIVTRAYDQMDGNNSRRRLGVYSLGYRVTAAGNNQPLIEKQTISFARMPDEDAVRLVYAAGSKSGYTPETVFDYIVSNEVNGDAEKEDFLDAGKLGAGNYKLEVYAEDFFGNRSTKNLDFEIVK